jgi:hypothetical protein
MRRTGYATAALAGLLLLLGPISRASAQLLSPLSWQHPEPIDVHRPTPGPLAANSRPGWMSDITCPSDSLCVAVDGLGNVVTSTHPTGGSRTWKVAQIDDAALETVHCRSVSLCLATDYNGKILTTTDPTGGAAAWKSARGPRLGEISCPDATLCVSVNGGPQILTATDPLTGPWIARAIPPEPCPRSACFGAGPTPGERNLGAISCPTASLCVIGDSQGDIVTSTNPTAGGSAWSSAFVDDQSGYAPTFGDIQTPILSVSCPVVTLCVASDGSGGILSSASPTGGASAWQLIRRATGAADEPIARLTCPSVERCIGLGSAGYLVGHLYTSEEPSGHAPWVSALIDPGSISTAISCPSVYLCAVVDQAGDVVIGRARRLDAHQLRVLLTRAYATHAPSIRALLRTGGVRLRFHAPLAGRIEIRWLLRSSDRRRHAVSRLLASGQYVFDGAVTRRIQLNLAPHGRTLLEGRSHGVVSVELIYSRPGVRSIVATGRSSLRR